MKSLSLPLAIFVFSFSLAVEKACAFDIRTEDRPGVTDETGQVAPSDWQGIRAAYLAGQRRVVPSETGHAARNVRQAWNLGFDGRGFLVEPDSGRWTWGMQLSSFGFENFEQGVSHRADSVASQERLEYEWCSGLREWFVNGAQGLEHGFTLERRLVGSGPLRFRLAVRGGLRGMMLPAGNGIGFADADGNVVLTYTGLRVFDALGVDQAASLSIVDGQVQIAVEESSAIYPLTIDPIAQGVYLKASNAELDDHFGSAVAVSGDTVAVGAYREDGGSTGVNGNQADNSEVISGAAYVFAKVAGVWSQQAYLKASNTGSADRFGYSLALDGDTLVVGAMLEDSDATGVNGDQSNDNAFDAGAVYVFQRTGTTWVQEAYLKASNAEARDYFGVSVSISDGTIVVGADHEQSASPGINGSQANNSGGPAGAAYVFVRGATTWVQQAYMKASNPRGNARFGVAVSVSDDVLVVGAMGEDSAGVGVNGNQSGMGAAWCGAAYIFERAAGVWSQGAYLKPNLNFSQTQFGASVAVSGETVVVGAVHAPARGIAYVYSRPPSGWQEQALLEPENLASMIGFAGSVAISGDQILVGANESSGASGVNGQPGAMPALNQSGAAYLFRRAGSVWSQEAYIKASNPDAFDAFGWSVAISDTLGVVGALSEDGGFTGPNAFENDNSAPDAGAAYIFELNAESASYCGPAPANSSGLSVKFPTPVPFRLRPMTSRCMWMGCPLDSLVSS